MDYREQWKRDLEWNVVLFRELVNLKQELIRYKILSVLLAIGLLLAVL